MEHEVPPPFRTTMKGKPRSASHSHVLVFNEGKSEQINLRKITVGCTLKLIQIQCTITATATE